MLFGTSLRTGSQTVKPLHLPCRSDRVGSLKNSSRYTAASSHATFFEAVVPSCWKIQVIWWPISCTNLATLMRHGTLISPRPRMVFGMQAAAKLRTALLSDSCNGQWQPGGTSMPAVIDMLQRKSLLSLGSESPAMDEVWCAMKTYAEVHGLPRMKTFNALAAHILKHADQKDPLRRGKIEIAK
ncbi:unnamed protein product [Cladocopium goreaui]|uniref:Uncharacterized protein n=1 Tax=Cladocopium goreaui TaxID=2562237 RepID=A0A9P1C6N9_9DINO|nr:unnamed protein product [Cladocopium goreaui]